MSRRLGRDFFVRDALEVAPALLGKVLVRQFDNGKLLRCRVVEVEAYRGSDDLACHASRGRTPRTEVMFQQGGLVYVYLIYGMYWMLNFVTGETGMPQAVLVRGLQAIAGEGTLGSGEAGRYGNQPKHQAPRLDGPGKLSRQLKIDREFYGEDLTLSTRLWIEDQSCTPGIVRTPRIGIDYAGAYWAGKPWRYVAEDMVNFS